MIERKHDSMAFLFPAVLRWGLTCTLWRSIVNFSSAGFELWTTKHYAIIITLNLLCALYYGGVVLLIIINVVVFWI